MLISTAYAQCRRGGGFDLMALVPLVLIFVVFYFLPIRPNKSCKEHKEMPLKYGVMTELLQTAAREKYKG